MTPDQIWEQLDAFARGMEPPVRKAFLEAIKKVRADLTEAELEYIARTGDLRAVLEKLDLTDYTYALRSSVLSAASHSTLPFAVRFNAFDPYAISAMQQAELDMVSNLKTEIVEGIRQYLQAGLMNGVNPKQTAVELRGIVGLTAKQSQAIANYRNLLTGGAKGQPLSEALRRATRDGRFDQAIQRAIMDRVPLKPASVERQLERFEQRMLKQRAETIARTETIDALARAAHMRWQQAFTEGKVQRAVVRRFWHVAKDERTCPICKAIPLLNPEGVGFNEPFKMASGDEIYWPTAHPNCRCMVMIRVVSFAKRKDLRKLARELSGLAQAA